MIAKKWKRKVSLLQKSVRFLCAAVIAVTVPAFSACEKGGTGSSSAYDVTAADADIWCAPGSIKILSTQPADSYADVRADSIELVSGRNEYETAQIIVTAKKDLKFTVELSDLVNTADETEVISKDNFAVYTQHYIAITRNWHGNNAPTGAYPDALLPQENAVKYDVNLVNKDRNGGAWLEYFIPSDAAAGTYKGTATVDLGKEKVSVPVSLKVYNVTLPDETNSKSLFTVNSNWVAYYERDNSQEMVEKYYDLLIKHRLSPTGFGLTDEEREGRDYYEAWAEKGYKLYKEGMSTLALSADAEVINGKTVPKKETIIGQLSALARLSLKVGEDLVWRTALYDYYIDEPFYVQYSGELIQLHIDHYAEAIDETLGQLTASGEFESELGRTILESVANAPLVVTDYFDDEFRVTDKLMNPDGTPFSYEGQRVALCPKVDGYHTAEQRAMYDTLAIEEKWWYNCNEPSYPYPSYHIDDTWVSAALMSWMMADYGITGNLYWGTNIFTVGGKPVENPYTLADVGAGSNGEGTIIYPGKEYGVDGPVGSVRLSAVLDGNEDYEIICGIKEAYEKSGLSADDILARITDNLYSGTHVEGDSAEFEEAREILLMVAEAAASPSSIMISDIEEIVAENGKKTFRITANVSEGSELYSDGEKLTGEGNSYVIEKSLDEKANYINLRATGNGSEATLTLYLGGLQKIYSADDMAATDFAGNYETCVQGEKGWAFTFGADTERLKVEIRHAVVKEIDASTALFGMTVYNLSDTAIEYKIYIQYSKFGRVEFSSGTLQPGANKLEYDNFVLVNWERNGTIESISIESDSGASIAVNDFVLYGV